MNASRLGPVYSTNMGIDEPLSVLKPWPCFIEQKIQEYIPCFIGQHPQFYYPAQDKGQMHGVLFKQISFSKSNQSCRQYPKNIPCPVAHPFRPCIVHIREYPTPPHPTPPLGGWGRTLRKFGKRFAVKALKPQSPSQLLGLESRNALCVVPTHC